MILLDTNIVSELYKPVPSSLVIAWLDVQPVDSLYLCTPVLAELRFGAELLDDGKRKDWLRATINQLENELYRERILVFDAASAAEYGRIAAARRRNGRTIQQMDGLIAAIALANRATLATRDINGFGDLGLDVINPFEAAVDRQSIA
ncbi:MAG: type II toxin-antitoxin system VapC family toxin [Rhizobiales bacterium]|nr:type II toxin-antitoxin system VapC family toxin [Hyphomicrobiales bacterium]